MQLDGLYVGLIAFSILVKSGNSTSLMATVFFFNTRYQYVCYFLLLVPCYRWHLKMRQQMLDLTYGVGVLYRRWCVKPTDRHTFSQTLKLVCCAGFLGVTHYFWKKTNKKKHLSVSEWTSHLSDFQRNNNKYFYCVVWQQAEKKQCLSLFCLDFSIMQEQKVKLS